MEVRTLLENRNITFEPSGRDYKIHCLNPEHDDKNPSLRVDSITGVYNCFVCGFKGNIFSYFDQKANFLQIKKELFKRKINEKLATNVGLEMPSNKVEFTQNWRGINAETYKQFEAFEHSSPHFIGRVVFPIRNLSGRIVGFNGRALTPEKQPKYLIYPAYSKFPLFPAKIKPLQGKVIIVEGIFDMLNLYDKGLTNVVCAFGTKKITKEKLNLLKMQGTLGLDIFFDGDDAGQKAAKDLEELAKSVELTTRNIHFKNTDPGELTAQQVIKLKESLYGKDSTSGDQT